MRRPVWLAAGVALGVGGTLWAEQRVRRVVRQATVRLSPEHVAGGAVDSVRQVGDRVRQAVDAGRQARAQREEELWAEMSTDRSLPPARRTTGPQGARTGRR